MPRVKNILFFIWLFGILINHAFAQKCIQNRIEQDRHARIMFYNCENLFDYIDDSISHDEEFLPKGERHWTSTKYYNKLNKTVKVIASVGGWKPVDIIGLCEIENKKVLKDLVYHSQLYLFEYQIIHKESPDKRGIDVAMLYQPKSYKPICNKFIPITFIGSDKKTRDILYSKGVLNKNDTLHIFINHWPSRWGGQLETEVFRNTVAQKLRETVDSIHLTNKRANIIIIGDLNDTPQNTSVKKTLGAQLTNTFFLPDELFNLSSKNNSGIGTHKHDGTWTLLDQIIVSGNLLDSLQSLYTTTQAYTIVNYEYLLEPDNIHLGLKPFRTFTGFKFNDGYSDHLPVFMDLYRHY